MRFFSIKGIGGIALGCFIVASVSAAGLAQSKSAGKNEKSLKNPVKPTPESIQAGEKIYQTRCAPCHGATGKGDGPVAKSLPVKPTDFAGGKFAHGSTDGDIFTNIRDGVAPDFRMKPFKGKIEDQDIWNAVNYIRSIGPKKSGAKP